MKLLSLHIDKYKNLTGDYDFTTQDGYIALIGENGYNLNITRYVNLSKDEEAVDLAVVQTKLVDIEKEITTARDEHNKFLRELGLKEIM